MQHACRSRLATSRVPMIREVGAEHDEVTISTPYDALTYVKPLLRGGAERHIVPRTSQ